MLYTLNLYSVVRQLFLNNTGKKKQTTYKTKAIKHWEKMPHRIGSLREGTQIKWAL